MEEVGREVVCEEDNILERQRGNIPSANQSIRQRIYIPSTEETNQINLVEQLNFDFFDF